MRAHSRTLPTLVGLSLMTFCPSASLAWATSVEFTSPRPGESFVAPATIELAAQVRDSSGVGIKHVEFFQGATSLRRDPSAPYTATWRDVAAGTYTLRAVATDKGGATADATVTVVVRSNTPPTVQWIRPTTGATFPAPATIELEVTAQDPDGVGIASVEFSQGTASLKRDFTTPYSYTWRTVPVGTYTLRAVATDKGGATTEAPVTFTVGQAPPPNRPPTITLTSPTTGATFVAPATIPLSATAGDPDGQVVNVEFFTGSTKLAEDTTAPYKYTWRNVAAGTYFFSAKATDNTGASATSNSVTITVTYIQPPPIDMTPPTVQAILPLPNPSLYVGGHVRVSATVLDTDPSPLEYRFAIDGVIRQPWSAATTYQWPTTASTQGRHTITVEARDAGGADSKTATVYLYLKPPGPPQ